MSDQYTPAQQVERQLRFEQERKSAAIRKFRKDNHRMQYDLPGGYLSGTPAGRAVTTDVVQQLIPALDEHLDAVAAQKFVAEGRVNCKELRAVFGTGKLLGITVKALIDLCGRENDLKVTPFLSNLAGRFAREYQRQRYGEIDPDLLRLVQSKLQKEGHGSYWTQANTLWRMEQRTETPRSDLMEDFHVIPVAKGLRHTLDFLMAKTGWFRRVNKSVGRNGKKVAMLELTPAFQEFMHDRHLAIEQELQQDFPMLCQPRPWSEEGTGGGYLQGVGRHQQLVKQRKGEMAIAPKTLQLINEALQPTAYQVNPFVAAAQSQLFMNFEEPLGDFIPQMQLPDFFHSMPQHLVERPVDDPDRIEWRKQKGQLLDQQQEQRKHAIRSGRIHLVSQMLLAEPEIWCPWSLGHVGRAYPLNQGGLNPQGGDPERSCLRFAEGAPVTDRAEHHLQIHLANSFGITRSHDEKLQWCADNHELIRAVASDPLGNRDLWADTADDPWAFAAACDEVVACVFDRTRHLTHLPVGMDATASGLQLLTLLSRDRETAERVNLVPGMETKQDVYAAMRGPLQRQLVEMGRPDLAGMDFPRKLLKGVVMPRTYGGTAYSRRNTVRRYLKGLAKEDVTAITAALEAAMRELLPGALAMFEALEKVGLLCSKEGKTVSWKTPVGNRVTLKPTQHPITRVDLGFCGFLRVADDRKESFLDINKLKSSTAPLFVHSLDAALLAEAFHDWRRPICTVHDCLLVRATDADDALQAMLRAYSSVMADPEEILNNLLVENGLEDSGIQFPVLNTMTDADISNISNCQYAMC